MVSIMSDDNKQPMIKGGRVRGISPYRSGTPRSVGRLKQLDYDPIGELVKKYNELEKEIQYQNQRRSGAIVELLPSGKPRPYSYEHHMALYDRQLRVGEVLLRYGYGRVPEIVEVKEHKIDPLIIKLSKEGDTYVINDNQEDDIEYYESEQDGD